MKHWRAVYSENTTLDYDVFGRLLVAPQEFTRVFTAWRRVDAYTEAVRYVAQHDSYCWLMDVSAQPISPHSQEIHNADTGQ